MSISEGLLRIANQLNKYEDYDSPELDAIEKAANTIGKSWSGSWLGYHSRVYYDNFQPPPPEAIFDKFWGLSQRDTIRGNWKKYAPEKVTKFISEQAGNPSVKSCIIDSKEAIEAFEETQQLTLSLVHANYDLKSNQFMANLVDKVESLEITTQHDFIKARRPSSGRPSMDHRATNEGLTTPPHVTVLSIVHATKASFQSCKDLKRQIANLANHIQNLEKRAPKEGRTGNKIFIGHGRSLYWREFKDFISDRLELPWDEFNRVSIAGIPNTIRLAQMLDEACMAFLVMTAEDEDAEGKLHARENVIHEAGLFQGRLGFERAIILLEEGCEEFSNIEGLGQIRFPKEDISAVFEEVRQVLEREGIIES